MTAIILFTDFGPCGPYLGQMESVLRQITPTTPVIHLLNNAPAANPYASSYLLAALRRNLPPKSIFLAIIDPSVGSERKALVLHADGQYFVGPDNGLLNTVAVQSSQSQWFEIIWTPENCSMSFHGRDLFAPVAAKLAGNAADHMLLPFDGPDLNDWLPDLFEVIYFDYYGNAMTGLRYHTGFDGKMLTVNGQALVQANTFSSVPERQAFWYKNSSDLIEIAVNKGSAHQQLGLELGMPISF